MSDPVLASLITGACLIVVQLIVNGMSKRTHDINVNWMIKEIKKDISRLETKQDRHNNLIERITLVERDIARLLGRKESKDE